MAIVKSFIRAKTFYCGGSQNEKAEYLEQDLFPMFDCERNTNGRGAKRKTTAPKQQDLNNKHSKRYCCQLAKTNFKNGDYMITLTYAPEYQPDTFEAAKKDIQNYIRRVKDLAKKRGCEVKYIYVTEQGSLSGKIHFHILLNSSCGISREELEGLWKKRYRKGMDKEKLALGGVNTKVIQEAAGGLEAIIGYMTKGDRNMKGRRTYNASHNLKKPLESTNDNKISKHKYMQLCLIPIDSEAIKEYFERQNPGYWLTDIERVYNEDTQTYYVSAKLKLLPGYRSRKAQEDD